MNELYCIWEERESGWFFLNTCSKANDFGNMFNLEGAKFNFCPFCGRPIHSYEHSVYR